MKRLLSLLLIFIMIFSVACNVPTDSDTNTGADSNDTIIDSDTEANANSDINKDEETKDSEKETDKEADKEDNEEKEEEMAEAPKEFGNFTTLHNTEESRDRNKQMNNSKADYNTGSKLSKEELDEIEQGADTIASGFVAMIYPNASKFMAHFLENTGENYELDLDKFFNDATTKENRNNDITEAMRAVEALSPNGEAVEICRKEENIHHNLSGDWKLSVGSYFTSIKIDRVGKIGNMYTATITYSVIDYYNWDSNDTEEVPLIGVSPAELHQLHVAGRAKEFLTYGERTYVISWVIGANAESAIND